MNTLDARFSHNGNTLRPAETIPLESARAPGPKPAPPRSTPTSDPASLARPAAHGPNVAVAVYAETVDVTPEMARNWLARGGKNRNLRHHLIDRYARDIKTGRWSENGEAIKISRTGRILDGQHRLHAVIRAKRTVRMLIVHNVADEAQATMDSGAKRTASDALALSGVKNSPNVASVARRALAWERSNHTLVERKGSSVSHPEILEFVSDTPSIHTAVESMQKHQKTMPMGVALASFCFWVCASLDHDYATLFFESLASGAQLRENDPILLLRNTLIRLRTPRHTERVSESYIVALTFKAWNFHRTGREVTQLRYGPKEQFPVPM